MIDDFDLLSLTAPAGNGQTNDPSDIAALDNSLRRIDVYAPPPEYAREPQRYATEPMIRALESFQERNGLKVDGYAKPGGPTERAINNRLLEKPKGVGLLYDPPAPLAGTVGNGFENRRGDVATVQRLLGAVEHIPEDPFDRPHGLIDQRTLDGIKSFQRKTGLTDDGWLAPGGETERALHAAVADLARAKGRDWLQYAERAGSTQAQLVGPLALRGAAAAAGDGARDLDIRPHSDSGSKAEAVPAMYDPRHWPPGRSKPRLEGGFSWGSPNRLYRQDPLPGTPRWRFVPIPIPPFLPIPLPRSADDEEPAKTELIPQRVPNEPYRGPDPAKPPLDPKATRPSPYPSESPHKPEQERITPPRIDPRDFIEILPDQSDWIANLPIIVENRQGDPPVKRLNRALGEPVIGIGNRVFPGVAIEQTGGPTPNKRQNTARSSTNSHSKRNLGSRATQGAHSRMCRMLSHIRVCLFRSSSTP
jgi:peptidoglycan hydrolase-like protein with peptidoglycan-binding domain